ncbi:MAG: ribosome biogenesis GTPase Der, partial [Anaerolineales bacterium]|nr:ribosome biogenesis GTPase Der [Anaerolineales bacterium]
IIIVINKWDAVPKDTHTQPAYAEHVRQQLNFLDYVPALFVSAKTGQRVEQILPLALRVQEERLRRIPTAALNRLVQQAQDRHAPPSRAGMRLKILYASQVRSDPPTFLFHVNDPKLVHFTYTRFLENRIREAYSFLGTPILLVFRKRESKRA